jgi:hypothetical protein
MGTGICLFLAGKMGLYALGMGSRFEQEQFCVLGHWDLVKILARKWE